MICALSEKQIENLYTYIYKSMIKDGDNFNPESFMQKLFDDIVKEKDIATASKFIQHIPKIISSISNKKDLGYIESSVPLVTLRQNFNNATEGLENVIKYFNKTIDSADAADMIKIVNKQKKEVPVNTETLDNVNIIKPKDFRPITAVSGLLSIFKPVNPNVKETDISFGETIDDTRMSMMDIFNKLSEESVNLPNSNYFNYRGKDLALHIMPVSVLKKVVNNLDPITNKERFVTIPETPNHLQPKDRNIIVVTNPSGYIVTFDKDGNVNDGTTRPPLKISNEKWESGNVVLFQYLRNIQNNKIYDFNGKQETLISPVQFAKSYKVSVAEAELIIQDSIDELQDLVNKIPTAKNDRILVKFEGLSQGIASSEVSAKVPFDLFIKSKQADLSVLKSMNNEVEDTAEFTQGTTTIRIEDQVYKLDRLHLPNDIAQQITDVVFDQDLKAETKFIFAQQFIPFSTTLSKMLMGVSDNETDTIKLSVYKDTEKKDLDYKLSINKESLKLLNASDLANYKQKFFEALTTAWAKKGMPMAYRPDLLKDNGDYLAYENGNIVTKSYFDFILNLNPYLYTSTLPNMFVSKQVLFSEAGKEVYQKPIINLKQTTQPVDTEAVTYDSLLTKSQNETNAVGSNLSYVFFNNLKYAVESGYITTRADLQAIIDEWNNLKSYTGNPNLSSNQLSALESLLDKLPGENNAEPIATEEQTDTFNEENTSQDKTDAQFNDDINPVNNTPVDDSDLYRAGYTADTVTQEQLDRAEDFWNNTKFGKMLQKHITLTPATNLANSDVFAKFFISGATLANPANLATIAINTNKGTFVDIYHEAWHAFSQLYLTKQQKSDLYNEVKNFKDASGKQPYKDLNFFQVEEMIAEDFRTYMKSQNRLDNRPKRNSLFRRILNFLKSLFGKKQSNSQDFITGVMEVPVINEWFKNLNFNSNKPGVFKNYKPLVENMRYSSLDRGVASVFNSRESVLSEEDGILISNSMDMIMSGLMNKKVKELIAKGINPANVQSAALGLLLKKEHRSKLYADTLNVLKTRLDYYTKQYQKQQKISVFSSFKTKEEIETNAAAVIKSDKGNKYVFLKSQIDNFKNLIPDIKRGDRIKGENWHGIRIVGDYYDFKPEGGKPIGIIVVSNIKDAEIQYNNYVKGGAQKYTGVEIKTNSLPALTEEQEIILDKIKILEKTIDNFGDTKWELKDEAPKGVIAYHLKNSTYDLTKKAVEIEEENDEDTENTQENDTDIFSDNKTGKQSVLQLAQKEVIYVLNSIAKIENGKTVLNKLGFPEKADFKKLFNILSKTTGGIRDRQIAYDRLLEAAKIHPEIKQLMDYKYPNPKATNKYAVQLSFAFFHTFSLPSVNYKQLTVFTKDQEGNDKKSFIVTDSSLETSSTAKKFSAYFNSAPVSSMIKKNAENTNYLVLDAFVKEFTKNNYFDKANAGKFLETLGIKLDPTAEVKNMMLPANIDKFINTNGVSVIYNIVKDFQRIQDDLANTTTEERTYLSRFLLNPVEVLSKPIPKSIVTGKVKDVSGYIKKLADIQVQYGFDSANPGVLLPDGNKVFANVNHSLLSTVITDLNTLNSLSEIKANPIKYGHLNYLLDTDAFVVQVADEYVYRSKILAHLFDRQGNKKSGKSLEFLFTAGTQIADISGVNTADLDIIGKNFQEFHTTLLAGVAELTRAAEKKSAFGIKPLGKIQRGVYDNIIKEESDHHWVNLSMFASKYKGTTYSNGEAFGIGYYLLPHLAAEFDRVREFRNNKDLYKNVIGFNRPLPSGKMAGEEFSLFAKMLSDETKNDLYNIVSSPSKLEDILDNNDGLRNKIFKDILGYFNTRQEEYTEMYFNKMPIVAESLYSSLGIPEEILAKADKTELNKILVKAFLYNDMISKIESFTLFTGDIVQYNHAKEEASKRIPGASSDGIIPVTDQAAYDYINNIKGFNEVTYAGQQKKNNDKIQLLNIQGTFNSAVIKDAIRTSVYLPEISNALYEDYYKNRPELSKEAIDKLVAKDIKAYTDMKESDGAAYLTIDAYRAIKKLFNDWSEEQDQLYKDIVNGKDVSLQKFNKTFPVSKLHYYGPLGNSKFKKLNARGMHKFAVAPINPLIAVPGTALYDLHNWMLEQNIQYTMFGSGSKATTLSLIGLDEEGKPAFDDIFADEKQASIKADAKVQNNIIYLNYFKEVTAIAAKFKEEVTVPTQKRVLVLDALFDAGNLKNSANKKVVDSYKKSVNDHTSILKTELLNKIGFKKDEDGNYTGKLNKFVELVRDELELKDTPEHLVRLLDVNLAGNLTMDFSIHPESDVIEKIIVNKIQKSIVKQKTKGEALVQVPTTFMNGIWDNVYKLETDLDKIQKYRGTNNLPFYKRGAIINKETGERAVTDLMKVAVALQGDFKNLLNLPDPANPETTIGNVDRLNELVQDDLWLQENRDKITISGPRIPTDAVNSIEAAEIWHFLPESFGNTVVVPTEIVAKAGSDYDADKIFFMFPNLNSNGTLIESLDTEEKDFITLLEETDELSLDKTYKGRKSSSLIEQQKKYLQNQLIKNTRDIIQLPDNYVSLVKPNEMYLVKDHVEFFRESAEYNPKKKVHDITEETDSYEEMPGTTGLEFEYNLSKFEQNLSGNKPLGILAKKNKWHTLMKTIGFILPKTYKKTIWNPLTNEYDQSNIDYDMVFRLPVNRTQDGNVSIANENNVDNVKIGDVFSHALQGILDRAKDPWPFLVQMVTEALPVMNHYLEAGASVPSVLKMMKSPLVDDYIRNQVYNNSAISQINREKPLSKSEIKKASLIPLLDKFFKFNDSKVLQSKIEDLKINEIKESLKDTDYELIITYQGNPIKITGESFANSKLINNNIDRISIKKENIVQEVYYRNVLAKAAGKNSFLLGKGNYYYAAQASWELAFGSDTVTEEELTQIIKTKDRTSMKSLAILLHMVQAEEQFKGQDDLEMAFSPDTNIVDTALQIINKQDSLDKLESTSKIDKKSLENLLKNSIISSFYQNDLILDLVNNVFSLKLNKKTLNFLKTKLETDYKLISTVFGTGLQGRDRFTNSFNNGLVNYIFQNYSSSMLDENGNITVLPSDYKGVPIVESKTFTEDAVLNKGVINVNLSKIQEDYKNLRFTTDQTRDVFTAAQNPFTNVNDYVKYLVVKQYLKSVFPVDSLTDNPRFKTHLSNNQNDLAKAYEVFLSERTLMNTFNRAYIMGTTKYKYTDQVLEVINNPKYNLKEKYSVLNNLSKSTTVKTGSILQLDNKALAIGPQASVYYKNLKQLGDLSVVKTNDPEDNKYITDVFQNFSMFMFYQHGVGYSPLGFTKIYDPEVFVKEMQKASNNFLENKFSDNVLEYIYATVLDKSQRFKNYLPKETDSNLVAKLEEMKLESALEEFSNEELEKFLAIGSVGNAADIINKRLGKTSSTTPTGTPVADIPQNKVSGIESFGSTVTANAEAIKALGANPHSIDMIEAGFRTRTTRSESEMAKYAIKVGDTIKHFGKSADGTTKNILAKVTAIHPKGTPGFKGTWTKEGWRAEDVNVIDRFKDGAAAIEFEVIKPTTPTPAPTGAASEYTNHSGGAKGYDAEWDIIGEEFGMVNNKHYLLPSDGAVSDPRLQAKGVKPVDATNDVGPVALQGPATGEAQIAVTNAERAMGRIEPNHTTRNTKKIRNYAQVKNADAIFAIGSLIPKGADITVARGQTTKKALVPQVNGGTSVAVQLGITMGKPTYVFNQVANSTYSQGWYKWDNAKQDFVSVNTPVLTKNFAGIGTSSNTTEAGKQAIRDVYANTFKATQPTVSTETVKAYRTSDTFSSKVNYAQRGSGLYYALDKPFQEMGADNKVEEVTVSYDPSKTLDATTEEGQTKFMKIKRSAIEGKLFNSMKESNNAVSEAMRANGYDSLIGWIDQDVKDAGRELVIYNQPTVEPVGEVNQTMSDLYTPEDQTKILDHFRTAPQYKNAYSNLSDDDLIAKINVKLADPEKRDTTIELLNNCFK